MKKVLLGRDLGFTWDMLGRCGEGEGRSGRMGDESYGSWGGEISRSIRDPEKEGRLNCPTLAM